MKQEIGNAMLLTGDCLEVLRSLPECFRVNCCVTSPPYYGLRDYGHEGQIGLEQTPDEYVARLVEVFREVRRVLADDGTLWLNLGDSYARQAGNEESKLATLHTMGVGQKKAHEAGAMRTGKNRPPQGLKPKDLLGIPWRVAFALQQPYYTGRIKDERDRIWLAAMLDAEGCIFIHKRKAGQNNGQGYQRQNDNYAPGVEISNTHLAVVERIAELAGNGSICAQEGGKFGRKQTLYRWNLRTTECKEFLRELYPYLVAKEQQARIAYGCPSSGDMADAAHQALIGLHRGSETDVDFAAPDPMFEPGFYLRQDIIWKKPNPMPESVKDRCTKAHEYIFLLTKSARYWYDAEAIQEASSEDSGFAKQRAKGVDTWQYNNTPERIKQTGQRTEGSTFGTEGRRNRRSVWTVATQPYAGAHFATFPPALIEPCILAGCPAGGTVLDPFSGSGTTGQVALQQGRKYLGIELNPEYQALAVDRITPHAAQERLFA